MEPPALDIDRVVRPVRRRLALQLGLRWGLRAAAAALLATAVLIVAAHFLPWPDADPLGGYRHWAILLTAVILVTAAGIILRRWPTVGAAVRQADLALDMKDRLTTAREFAAVDGPLLRLQRSELRDRLVGVDLRGAVHPSPPRRETLLACAAGLLVLGTAVTPNPRASELARQHRQQAVVQAAAHRTAAAIAHIIQRREAPSDRRTDPRTLAAARQTEAVLRRLQADLAAAKTPAEALRALTAAQQRLTQLHPNGAQAQRSLQAVAHALENGPTKALAGALSNGNSQAAQQALTKLAESLPKRTPQQRAALARQLERAANSVPGNIGDALRQTAFNLSDNNLAGSRQALKQAAQRLGDAQSSAQDAARDQQASNELQQIKQDVANSAAGNQNQQPTTGAQPGAGAQQPAGQQGTQAGQSGSQATGKGSTGSGPAAGQGQPKAGQGGRQGQGKNGSGKGGAGGRQGQGTGAGNGQSMGTGSKSTSSGSGSQGQPGGGATSGARHSPGAGQGNGQGGSGGHSAGGGSSGGGGGTGGRYESIYLPGQQGKGPSVTSNGPLGRAVPLQSAAFQQLLPQYSSAADSSLGRVSLPPAMQDAVKRYFQALGQG